MTVSLYGNLFFVIVELVMSVFTGSQAVLLDAIYDGIEFFMLLPSIFLIPLLYKPANEEHPFGYLQWETIFLVIKGITMTTVTLGLILNNVNFLIHGGRQVAFDTVAYFELFACVLGVIVYLYLERKNRSLNSPLIEAEKNGWGIDSVISLGMTAAFFLPKLITARWFRPFVPYLDPVITVLLSMVMLPIPVKTVVTAVRDLLLIAPEEETQQEIKELADPFVAECRGVDHYYSVVRTGRKLWIRVYVFLDRDEISLSTFKDIQTRAAQALKKEYQDVSFKLVPQFRAPEA